MRCCWDWRARPRCDPAGANSSDESGAREDTGAGAIIQRLVAPGADVLLGAFTDPDLGRVVALGPGGQQAGLADTIAVRLPPVTDVDADELIASCHAVADELDRFRGSAALDRQALRELILRFALLLGEVPEVVEADLNPIRCTTDTSLVLDTQMRIEPAAAEQACQDMVTVADFTFATAPSHPSALHNAVPRGGCRAATTPSNAGDRMTNLAKILLVEDNPDDESLTVNALRMGTNATVEVARDGEAALDYLNHAPGTPAARAAGPRAATKWTVSTCYDESAKTTAHA